MVDNICCMELKEKSIKIVYPMGYSELKYDTEEQAAEDMDRLCNFISTDYTNLDKKEDK